MLSPFLVRITRPRLSRGGDRVLPPLFSRYFSSSSIFNATIRNMPFFVSGIHNEQYDCDMVII